jgi:hypothetical protein
MHLGPICVVVAVCAFIAGLRVIIAFALGKVIIVATCAGCGHAFENTTLVAFFASDFGVSALKGKLCVAVVKVLIDFDTHRLGLRGRGHSHEPKARDKNHDDLQQHMKPANSQIFPQQHAPLAPQTRFTNRFCPTVHRAQKRVLRDAPPRIGNYSNLLGSDKVRL